MIMFRYMLVLLIYAIMCCLVAGNTIETDTIINGLTAPGKFLNTNGNLIPAQQIIYVYGPRQWKMQNNIIDKTGNDYLITPGMGAHKLHIRQLPWNKARRICIQEGGHLAILNSNSEEKLLVHMLEENKISEAWLGVHDLYEEGDWNTIMDESMEATGYSKWTSNTKYKQPNNADGNQHCGILLKDGGMNDVECTLALAFFCEISL
ncbi:hemolymph lipopolysaccharide-binding protein [Monomorium pharaonis]|uniref:hemolymph lipopolysaccharide-binding protein n=1 Tax=Monomorium pharaonis TaxID=307658 RepID=UPI00063F35DA|nr:hemolymph lipopolysaccharide-binding protein [Monomorium pharaonis]